MFDYTIIGAGPTGITLAFYLSQLNKKVLLVDRGSQIGGIHAVKRVNGLYTKHSPTIYVYSFYMFQKLLKDMNISYNEIFTPYNFGPINFVLKSIEYFSLREFFIIAIQLLLFLKKEKHSKIPISDFAEKNDFSAKAKWYIDRACRLTDGAGSDRTSTWQFINIFNQLLYPIYQLRKPSDVGLFSMITKILLNQNVKILLNTEILDLIPKGNIINTIKIKNNKNSETQVINSKNIILAIPPYSLIKLLEQSNIKNAFGNLKKIKKWEQNVRYIEHIAVTYHWNKNIQLPKVWGFPESEWGIVFIVDTDYINFKHKDSKTVISTSLTIHSKSTRLNKKPNECTQEEIKNEVFKQLKIAFPNLPKPTHAIMSQNTITKGRWKPLHRSFIATKHGYIDFFSKYKNLYTCGTHNGFSKYSFTSIETAVSNAVKLLHILIPKTKKIYTIQNAPTITNILSLITAIIIISLIITIYFTNK